MEAGVVVICRRLVEPEPNIRPRSDKLGGIDGAGLDSADDFTTGDIHHRGAHSAQHLGAKLRHTIAQTLEILRRVYLLPKPAAHLHTDIGGRQRLDIELSVNLVPHRLPAAKQDPRAKFVSGHTVGHPGEKIQRRRLVLKIGFVTEVHLRDAVGDGIKDL